MYRYVYAEKNDSVTLQYMPLLISG